MASIVEPPIAGILEQASRLHLTTEQKAQLSQLELDFEKAARLISEKQLLEVELRRRNLSNGTLLSLTPEQLALIDQNMAKLRLAWSVGESNHGPLSSSTSAASTQH